MKQRNTVTCKEADRILSEFAKSGLSRKEFCRSRNIKIGTFHWWMKRGQGRAEDQITGL